MSGTLLQHADEVEAILSAASVDEPGGALSASAATARRDALRPIETAVRVAGTDLTRVVEHDDLSVEGLGALGRVVLGVASNVATANFLDRDVLDVEANVVWISRISISQNDRRNDLTRDRVRETNLRACPRRGCGR